MSLLTGFRMHKAHETPRPSGSNDLDRWKEMVKSGTASAEAEDMEYIDPLEAARVYTERCYANGSLPQQEVLTALLKAAQSAGRVAVEGSVQEEQ